MENNKCNRVRDKTLSVRFSQTEYAKIHKHFEKSKKKNWRDFLLSCITEKKIIVIQDLPEIIVELKKQGNNLNQIAKALNSQYDVNVNSIFSTINESRSLYIFLQTLGGE